MKQGTVKSRILHCLKCLTSSTRFASVALAIVLALVASPLKAQNTGATSDPQSAPAAGAQNSGGIRGQVADPSGAVIPNATVVVLDSAGKTAGKATSDNGGVYTIHGLTPGTYSVWVTAEGFAAFRVPSIAVAAGQMKNVNPALQIEVQQQVQVEAENTIGTAPRTTPTPSSSRART